MTLTLNERMTDEQIKMLENAGFHRWTKYEKDRLYVTEEAVGLDISRYNTGNVSSASLNGEGISNSEAKRILSGIDGAFVDVETSKLVVKSPFYTNKATEIIEKAIARI